MDFNGVKKIVVIITFLTLQGPAYAGINDPWFLEYKASTGSTIQLGPFDDKYACDDAKFSLPEGAQYLGCHQ
jgi:hypothetical protein